MEINKIISLLRNEKKLSQAAASERAYAMMANILGRHPRSVVTTLVFEKEVVVVCLKNGTQVKFDPKTPVPIWKYNAGKKSTASRSGIPYANILHRISKIKLELLKNNISEELRANLQEELDNILKKRGAKSVEELEDRIILALEDEET